MKILLVIDNLGSGGAQNQMTLLALGLSKRGCHVDVFTYHPQDFFKKRLDDANIKVYFEKKKGKVGVNVVKSLVSIIRANEYTTIISFLETPNLYASIAKILSCRKVRLIVSYRSMTTFESLSLTRLYLQRLVNKVANIIVANSHHEKERWIARYPSQKSKWHTIYNTVVMFDNNVPTSNRQNYLVVGSIGPDKNGLTIIEAIYILKSKGINVKITWIGQKVYEIAQRKAYINAMTDCIERYKLEENWTWKDPTHDLTTEYTQHRALILASKTEGLPNVVCEALSVGTPCIVSNTLDHPILVEEDVRGFLFSPDDPRALAYAILRCESLSEIQYKEISEASMSYSRKTFDYDTFINKYLALIK